MKIEIFKKIKNASADVSDSTEFRFEFDGNSFRGVRDLPKAVTTFWKQTKGTKTYVLCGRGNDLKNLINKGAFEIDARNKVQGWVSLAKGSAKVYGAIQKPLLTF